MSPGKWRWVERAGPWHGDGGAVPIANKHFYAARPPNPNTHAVNMGKARSKRAPKRSASGCIKGQVQPTRGVSKSTAETLADQVAAAQHLLDKRIRT